MNVSRLLFLTGLSVGAVASVHAFDPVKGLPRVEVGFTEPDKFTDVSDSAYGGSDRARDATLAELRTYLIKQANRLLAAGQQLRVTVTDVDLAGEFEPWRGAQWSDIRVVKDIYPPSIKLAFQLTDASGQVLKQGDRNLRDLSFMMTLSIDRNDPLRYEKAMLDSWLREEFRAVKR